MPDARPAHIIRGPEDFAAAFGVAPESIARLILYEQLLRQWQKAVNLVAPSTLDAIWHRSRLGRWVSGAGGGHCDGRKARPFLSPPMANLGQTANARMR
jgi:hypothetical protein